MGHVCSSCTYAPSPTLKTEVRHGMCGTRGTRSSVQTSLNPSTVALARSMKHVLCVVQRVPVPPGPDQTEDRMEDPTVGVGNLPP